MVIFLAILNNIFINIQEASLHYFTLVLIVLSSLLLTSLSTFARYNEIITVENDILTLVQELTKNQKMDEIIDFSHPKQQREVVDFIMIQKALKLGGLDIKFNFRPGFYDARNLKALASGHLLVSFDSIWLSEAKKMNDSVYISKPVVKKGDFWAGVYTSPNNKKALSIKTLDDFKQLSLVSSKVWATDWATLKAINPRQLNNEGNWFSMAKLVSIGWVDAMLVSFNKTEPFTYKSNEYHIVAVNGVKIKLDDSRHYCVSKKHPLGEKTFKALEKGLAILQAQQAITKAYNQVGFFNSRVANWKVLNEDEVN